MTNDKDLTSITNRLQVPMVVQDILDQQSALDADTSFAIHETLSDFEPDSALLAMAIAARKLAGRFQHRIANLMILKIEAERIIEDYAGLWISNAKDKPLDDNLVFDTLMNIPEDFEMLVELLEINQPLLARHSQDAADLCEILIIQANAQILVAETFIEMIENPEDQTLANDNGKFQVLPAQMAGSSNVINFPGQA